MPLVQFWKIKKVKILPTALFIIYVFYSGYVLLSEESQSLQSPASSNTIVQKEIIEVVVVVDSQIQNKEKETEVLDSDEVTQIESGEKQASGFSFGNLLSHLAESALAIIEPEDFLEILVDLYSKLPVQFTSVVNNVVEKAREAFVGHACNLVSDFARDSVNALFARCHDRMPLKSLKNMEGKDKQFH